MLTPEFISNLTNEDLDTTIKLLKQERKTRTQKSDPFRSRALIISGFNNNIISNLQRKEFYTTIEKYGKIQRVRFGKLHDQTLAMFLYMHHPDEAHNIKTNLDGTPFYKGILSMAYCRNI